LHALQRRSSAPDIREIQMFKKRQKLSWIEFDGMDCSRRFSCVSVVGENTHNFCTCTCILLNKYGYQMLILFTSRSFYCSKYYCTM
jgi:hypothetical protein